MNDLAKWNVHGPVQTLRTEHVEWDLSLEQWKVPEYFGLVRFHPEGRISESESHNRDGSVSRSTYVYDTAGRMQELQFGMNGVPTGKNIYSHDESGRLLRIVNVEQDGTQRESEACSYSPDGKMIKVNFVPKRAPNLGSAYGIVCTEQSYTADGAPIVTTRYDIGARPDEALIYDDDRRLLMRVIFTRDSSGRLASEEMHRGEPIPFPDGLKELEHAPEGAREAVAAAFAKVFGAQAVMSSTTYSYDARGRLAERSMRRGEFGGHRTTYRYDDRDRLIEESNETTSRRMQMNEQGNLSPTKETSNVQHFRFEYEYDVQGNWTERVAWIRTEPNPNFERSNAVRREVTYYAP